MIIRRGIFFDRDGVLIEGPVINGLPCSIRQKDELKFIKSITRPIRELKRLGYYLFLFTNQPDVARGHLTLEFVDEINNIVKSKYKLDDIMACTHDDLVNCNCRKPKPGMLLQLAKKWDISLVDSYVVGDRWKDIEAGKKAESQTIFIDRGYNEKKTRANYQCKTTLEAIEYIISKTQLQN